MAIHGRTDLAAAQDAARGDVHALSEQLGAGLLTAAEWTAAADGVLAALATTAAEAVLRGGPQAAVARALGLHLALVRAGLAAYSTTVAGMNRAARASVPTALLPPLLPPAPPPPGPPGREGPVGPPGRDARGLRGLAGVPGVGGPPGPPGPPGGAGRDGGPGLPGRRGLPGAPGVSAVRWAGAWQAGWPYRPGDFVGHAGGCWVALRPTRGELPGVIAGAWDIVAVPGEDGAPGPAGPAGRDGVDGSDGARGSRGPSGRPGDPGPAGPPGVEGAAGAAFLSGAGAPPLTLGRAGDAYINVETGDLYRRTTTWTQTGHLRGPRGDRGAPGPRGATGRPGPPGTSLIIGTGGGVGGSGGNGSGAPGPPGPAGPAGPAGAAATVDVGTTTTGAPGTPAAVTNRGTPSAAVFDFVIPAGEPGAGGTGGTSFDDTAPPTTSAVAEAPAAGDDAFAARRDHVHGREAFGTPGTAAFGDSASAGTAAAIPHADHRHGMPANPVSYGSPAASAVGDTAADGAATTLPRSDHRHAREGFGAAGASTVTDAGAAGSAATVAHSDHQHAREGFGAPSTQAFGDSAVTGTAATVPHADHKHAMPANPVSYGSPGASAVADTSADGVATTLPRSDHRHAREGFGAPSTQAFGDAAVTGTALTVPHSDHKHALPANPVSYGTPGSSAVGDAVGAGVATALPRADHTHGREAFGAAAGLLLRGTAADGSGASPLRADAAIKAFDTTAPAPSAPGDAAAVGTVDFAARRDHTHGREGWGLGPACTVVATSNVAVLAGQGHVIDGYTVQAGDRVLLTAQAGTATSNQNGPWIAGGTPWVRPADYPTGGAVLPNRLYLVSQGTAYHETGWTLNNNSASTVDTTPTGWTQVAGPFAAPTIALGSSAADGSAGTPLRSDSTIAAFDATAPTTQAFADAAAVGTAAFAARRDHRHGLPANPLPAYGSPGASAVGDTAADGVATTLPRSDHRHAREGFGTPGTAAFGASPAAGAATTVARSDHAHGMPANPTSFATPTIALGTAAAAGALGTVIRSDATIAAFDATAPTTSAVADAAAAGSAAVAARRDHVHGREAFGAPGASAVGDTTANGTALTPARSDHRHAREAFGTPTVALGTVAAAGSATTPLRSDSTLVAFDATVPETQAFGDAAAVGSVAFAARRDHRHGMPAYPSFNGLINGDFAFAQTGLISNPLVSGQRNLDDWAWSQSGNGQLYQTRIDGAAAQVIGGVSLSTYTYINVITARTTSAASDYYVLLQYIEGWDARHLVNGCAFSGWFNPTLAGTYCFAFRNRAATISYVHPVTLSANVWTYVTFAVPAMPSASITGNMRENAGMLFTVGLAAGSTWQTTPDSWNAGNFIATSAQTNFPATLSAQFYMHALNLVPGAVPQPFVPLPYEQELNRVMRHRQLLASASGQVVGPGQVIATTTAQVPYRNPVEMVASPSLVVSSAGAYGIWTSNGSVVLTTGLGISNATPRSGLLSCTVAAAPGVVTGNATILQQQATGLLYLEAYPT